MPPPTAPSPSLLRHLRLLINGPLHTQSLHLPYSPRHTRPLTTTPHPSSSHPNPSTRSSNPYAPTTHDRGPTSTETTQTDFSAMDIFSTSSVPLPATSIDACTSEGFHLNNNVKTTDGSGVILVGGESFLWRPWLSSSPTSAPLLDKHSRLHLPPSTLSIFALLHPKPDLLILGTGSILHMLHPATRSSIMSELGMRVDVMDTGNASAAYNLLAQERGVEGGGGVGALLLPLGWRG